MPAEAAAHPNVPIVREGALKFGLARLNGFVFLTFWAPGVERENILIHTNTLHPILSAATRDPRRFHSPAVASGRGSAGAASGPTVGHAGLPLSWGAGAERSFNPGIGV